MHKLIRLNLLALLLVSTTWGCLDHSLRPATSFRLRLKTATLLNANGSTTQTNFAYDQQNRQIGYDQGNALQATITYSAQNQYQQVREVRPNGESIITFSYSQDPQGYQLVTLMRYPASQGVVLPGAISEDNRTYALDSYGQPVYATRTLPGNPTPSRAQFYRTSHIERVEELSVTPRINRLSLYEYDEKLNPFFGLLGPGIDEIRRYDRSNVSRVVTLVDDYTNSRNGVPTTSTIRSNYTYEYNAQQLPTRSDSVAYTYESY